MSLFRSIFGVFLDCPQKRGTLVIQPFAIRFAPGANWDSLRECKETTMKRVVLALTCAVALSSLAAGVARADIYQWAWVNPSDPSLGKYQSTTLCPGGAGKRRRL